jgi:hypothetical protein
MKLLECNTFLEVTPMIFAEQVKNQLLSLIEEMANVPWLFSKNPSTDFSRIRKLDFASTIQLILSMESSSIKKELLDYFKFSPNTPSASAFNQQRNKILLETWAFLFHEFNSYFPLKKKYNGYQLFACDGSDLNIALNPKDEDTYLQSKPTDKGYNQLHLNVLFDLCSKRYVDAFIQPSRRKNESLAMTQMIDRYHGEKKTIFIADRGYETYNIFAHVQEKGMYYLIRVKDGGGGSMIGSFHHLPRKDEFDHDMHLILTRKKTNEVKAHPELYKTIERKSPFDYVDLYKRIFYPMDFRVVRFAITESSYECIITNLPRAEFPIDEIKKLYAMRWGIETSFRELKYAIGLSCFHSKKVEYILQEIYARLILYNYCEIITMNVVIHQKDTKHVYQMNYTIAIHVCRYFLRNDISPPNVEELIQKNLLPIRPGRSDPRKVRPKSVVSFLYRVA